MIHHGEIDGNFYYTPTFENSERNLLVEEKYIPFYDKIGKNYDNESPIARERGLRDCDANKGFKLLEK